jgi:hypothetical protein
MIYPTLARVRRSAHNGVMRTRLVYAVFIVALAAAGILSACTLTEPPTTPVPTPDIPRVRFMFPDNNARVIHNSELTVDIVAEDQSAGIARVIFLVDGTQINEGAPASGVEPVFRVAMNWVAGTLGGHTLHAIAYRPDGTQSDEEIILVDVVAP